MREQFIHFSCAPLTSVQDVAQTTLEKDPRPFKPRGLWFSVEGNDDGWRHWCESEGYCLPNLTCQTEIILAETANVIRISTPDEIDDFTKQWARAQSWMPGMIRDGYSADWSGIAQGHDGIIIAPYIWERRMTNHTMWYYTWDCASGCIWNAKAVKELRPLGQISPEDEREANIHA